MSKPAPDRRHRRGLFPNPVAEATEAFEAAKTASERARRSGERDPETGLTVDAANRAYYEALGAVLRAYWERSNWNEDRTVPRVPLARHPAFIAGQLVDDLLAGRVPLSVKRLFFGRKRPGVTAGQRRAIEVAVRYVVASRWQGKAARADAVKLVAECYGVETGTVNGWVRKHWKSMPLTLDDPAALKRMVLNLAKFYDAPRHMKARPK